MMKAFLLAGVAAAALFLASPKVDAASKMLLATFPFPYMSPGGVPTGVFFLGSDESTANASTYTFTSFGVGSTSANRKIIVAVGYGASSSAVTSMTIGGVSAECLVPATATNVSAEIWQATVPSGSTATIVVNLSGSPSRCKINVYKILTEQYFLDRAWSSTTTTSITVSDVNVKTDGYLIAVGSCTANEGQTFGYNGIDSIVEDNDSVVESGTAVASASVVVTESPGAVNDVTFSSASNVGRALAVASWEPARTYAICEYYYRQVSVSSLTTYTFSKMPIGKPDAGRLVVAAIHWNTSSSTKTLSSCTIGGVSATIEAQVSTALVGVAIVSAVVPSGEVADVSFTMSAGVLGAGVAVYRTTPASTTPVDFVTNSTGAATSIPLTDLAVSNGGFAVAVGLVTGTATITWNGTDTISQDFSIDTDGYGYASAHVLTTETNSTRDFTVANSENNDIAAAAVSWL
jgi:hypothetical protein